MNVKVKLLPLNDGLHIGWSVFRNEHAIFIVLSYVATYIKMFAAPYAIILFITSLLPGGWSEVALISTLFIPGGNSDITWPLKPVHTQHIHFVRTSYV